MKTFELNNKQTIPAVGFGVFMIPNDGPTYDATLAALKAGYRHIDTAAGYCNESDVGKAIKDSGIDRSEIFITSKLWLQDYGYENAKKGIETSMKLLGADYIDLYLLHQPYGDYYGSWKAMEELYQQGKIKAIGVCNFSPERFMDLYMNSLIHPMINQLEFHPFYQQKNQKCVLKQCDCLLEAWGPLNEGQRDIFHHPMLLDIAKKHQKSVSQIILRWHLENHIIAIPKTTHLDRMQENIDIFDFQLDEEDKKQIEQLDLGYSEIIDHQNYMTAKWLNKYKIHD